MYIFSGKYWHSPYNHNFTLVFDFEKNLHPFSSSHEKQFQKRWIHWIWKRTFWKKPKDYKFILISFLHTSFNFFRLLFFFLTISIPNEKWLLKKDDFVVKYDWKNMTTWFSHSGCFWHSLTPHAPPPTHTYTHLHTPHIHPARVDSRGNKKFPYLGPYPITRSTFQMLAISHAPFTQRNTLCNTVATVETQRHFFKSFFHSRDWELWSCWCLYNRI